MKLLIKKIKHLINPPKKPRLPLNQSPWYRLLILIDRENPGKRLLQNATGMNVDQLIRYVNPLSQQYKIKLVEVNNHRWN